MPPPGLAEYSLRSAPRRIALGYAILAGIWVLLSDRVVASEAWSPWAQTVKGGLFVLVTAAALYLLVARLTRQVLELHAQLHRHASELEARVAERTAELLETNRELDTFVHAASHDLRAPIRSVAGFAQALQEDYGDRLDGEGRVHLERILAGAERMDALVLDLRDYNRLGRQRVELAAVPLEPLVGSVLDTFHHQAREAGAEVTVEPPLPAVQAEPRMLSRALQNLVDNALKFVAGTGPARVRIRAEPRGGRVRIWVEDHGIGIPADRLDKVFEPFERLHASHTYPGSGLGLAIVRRSVERMGGRVGAESAPGQGSRFWIELPAAPHERTA